MNNDLLNILSNSDKDIDNQQLMAYLSGQLSGEQQHAVEQSMADSEFMNDAVEGLQNISDKKDLQTYVDDLNAALQKSMQKKETAPSEKTPERRTLGLYSRYPHPPSLHHRLCPCAKDHFIAFSLEIANLGRNRATFPKAYFRHI